MTIVIPVLRVFDYAKTIEFYMDWLGCKMEWKHAPEGSPFYMRVSLHGARFDLSEHHGECSPGGRITLEGFEGLESYHRGLLDKNYKFMKPGIGRVGWAPDTLEVTVIDPFFNRIIFNEVV